MQYVFAITEPLEPVVGGHVWRSDNYGRIGSWTDVTKQMPGKLPDASFQALTESMHSASYDGLM